MRGNQSSHHRDSSDKAATVPRRGGTPPQCTDRPNVPESKGTTSWAKGKCVMTDSITKLYKQGLMQTTPGQIMWPESKPTTLAFAKIEKSNKASKSTMWNCRHAEFSLIQVFSLREETRMHIWVVAASLDIVPESAAQWSRGQNFNACQGRKQGQSSTSEPSCLQGFWFDKLVETSNIVLYIWFIFGSYSYHWRNKDHQCRKKRMTLIHVRQDVLEKLVTVLFCTVTSRWNHFFFSLAKVKPCYKQDVTGLNQ